MAQHWVQVIKDLLSSSSLRGQFVSNASLARYTSWRVGGPAEYLYCPADIDDLVMLFKQIPVHVPITWLGLGSNTLVRDGGVTGLVVITQGCLSDIKLLDEQVLRVEVGVAAAKLARFCARVGLSGLEFLAGIPGTIGGALRMNAGCFGHETWEFVKGVEILNRQGELIKRTVNEFDVAYRTVKLSNDEWFIAGLFQCQIGKKERSLDEIKSLLKKRAISQPTGKPSCGSVFRNPAGEYSGRLIERSGLKGFSIGGAKVSEKHANFILNEHGATAKDIEALIHYVADTVEKLHGIRLIPEVHIVGKN